jgi:hypothetical protein
MAAETQYTANTGMAVIGANANTSLTGSGSLGTDIWTVITAATAPSKGTLVKTITVKSAVTTAEGVVRLFIYDGANARLIHEILVPPITIAATTQSFEHVWNCDLVLAPGNTIRATTQVANSFNVIAEGLDWKYFSGSVRPESTNFTANNGTTTNQLVTGNSSMTGSSGTTYTVFTAGSSATYNGCRIESVTLKAIVTTTTGMVRLFISGGGTTALFREIFIPGQTLSSTEPAFETTIPLNGFQLQAGYSIIATTQNTETFNLLIEGSDWAYPGASMITNFTPTSGTSTTSEELLHSLAVPAGLFSTGDVMKVYADLITTNSANNKTFRIYVNTSATLSGATKLATVVYTTTAAESIMRLFPIISATSMGAHNGATTSAQTQYEASTGTTANVTVPTTASAFYVLISGQKATAGETDTVQWSMVLKENY